MKVEVGGVGVGVTVGEDAEDGALPGFGVDGVVKKGVAHELLAIEVNGERIVTGGAGEGLCDGGEVLGRCEGDLGAVRIGLGAGGRGEVDGGGLAAEEMGGGEGHAPRGRGAARGVNGAAAPCEGGDTHPRRVFALGGGGAPAGFAEGEQNRGVGDACAVVGDGDAMGGGVRRGDAQRGAGVDVEAGRFGAAGILQEFGENRGEAIGCCIAD